MNEYFYFSQTERRYIALFCLVLSLVFLLPQLYGHYFARPSTISWESLGLDSLPTVTKPSRSKSIPDSLFAFNPNTCSQESFLKLGLSPRLSKTILNYRSKGGQFRRHEDLLKIYGMDTTWYEQVKTYINIPQQKRTYPKTFVQRQPKKVQLIEVNTATREEWQGLRGIGPAFSARIVKFRDKLGGFHALEQVAETYGLPDSTFQQIRPFLHLKSGIQKLEINQLSLEELAAHPYIDWKMARLLINYRNAHGPYLKEGDLYPIRGISEDKKQRIYPYFAYKYLKIDSLATK